MGACFLVSLRFGRALLRTWWASPFSGDVHLAVGGNAWQVEQKQCNEGGSKEGDEWRAVEFPIQVIQ